MPDRCLPSRRDAKWGRREENVGVSKGEVRDEERG